MATLQEYYNQLGSIYDPQAALIKQQQAQIPGQYEAQKSALEQAKINAFRDISNTASARGMTFSGFNPQQQAIYVGEKFLPAMANLATSQQESQNALTQALNKINAERGQTALGYYESAQQAEAANAAKIEAARIKAAATAAKATSSTTSKFKAQDVISKDTGAKTGVNFYGPNNQPLTASQYYSGIGGTINDLYSFLANDVDPTSKQAAADLYASGEITQELINKYPWIFGE